MSGFVNYICKSCEKQLFNCTCVTGKGEKMMRIMTAPSQDLYPSATDAPYRIAEFARNIYIQWNRSDLVSLSPEFCFDQAKEFIEYEQEFINKYKGVKNGK